jgi:metallo-beta-lactamase class B
LSDVTRKMMVVSGLAVAVLVGVYLAGQTAPAAGQVTDRASLLASEHDNLDLQRVPAFRAFDNLYYVGVGWVGAWLVTTADGLILIDTVDRPAHVDHLLDGVRRMGFDPRNISYVVVTHADADHYAGAAWIQREFGAQVAMSEADWLMVEAPPGEGEAASRPEAPRRDLILQDGEKLTLGTTTLRFWSTPGHTPGAMSVDFTVFDNGQPHRAFLYGGGAATDDVRGVEQFLASIEKVERLQDGVQVRIVSHPSMDAQFWERRDQLLARRRDEANPMVDGPGFRAWIQTLKASATRYLDIAGGDR